MKKTTIGGQALIEGVMMRGPESIAIAVRKPDGEIVLEKKELKFKKNILTKVPGVRGVIEFFRMMVVGVKALMFSAEFVDVEEEDGKESKFDTFLQKVFGDKMMDVVIYTSVILSIGFSVGLFFLLPQFLANLLHFDKNTASGVIYFNLFEGVIRIAIFLGYIMLTSLLKDIQRVWQYHGAEHKTIHCYEHEEELTVENVRKFTTKHPRCGTSFLFIVMIISILVFAFTGWHNIWINLALRLLFVPVIAGLSYEVLKFAGRHCENPIIKVMNMPGMAFQYFTTREPDDKQIEVAIEAFKSVLVNDEEADKW
ncbi:MAG: DUF1385 domain-containing protein [Clostridia bacterium]|nr:DUF1385 domain-containing protein [Clostridia bacterium]